MSEQNCASPETKLSCDNQEDPYSYNIGLFHAFNDESIEVETSVSWNRYNSIENEVHSAEILTDIEDSSFSAPLYDEIEAEHIACKTDSPRAVTQFPHDYCDFADFKSHIKETKVFDDVMSVTTFENVHMKQLSNVKPDCNSIFQVDSNRTYSFSRHKRRSNRNGIFCSRNSLIPALSQRKRMKFYSRLQQSNDDLKGLTADYLKRFDEVCDVDDLDAISEDYTSVSSLYKQFPALPTEIFDEKKSSSKEDYLCAQTASLLDLNKPMSRTKSELDMQFQGKYSKKSSVVKKILSYQDKLVSSVSAFCETLETKSIVSSNSSLCAQTDAEIILDPLARPSKRMSKANNRVYGDNDVWVEKILVNKKTRKERSFFYSIKTGERKADEPPTGASKVIYIENDFSTDEELLSKRKRNAEKDLCGDNDAWVEKTIDDSETGEERSVVVSQKTGVMKFDEPPTGASRIIFS